MNIANVIAWKFNNQPGMRCKEIDGTMQITDFPGGVPSQQEQDMWTAEYAAFIANEEEITPILEELELTDKEMARIGEEAIDILISDGALNPVNLSQEARNKLARRKELRSLLAAKQAKI